MRKTFIALLLAAAVCAACLASCAVGNGIPGDGSDGSLYSDYSGYVTDSGPGAFVPPDAEKISGTVLEIASEGTDSVSGDAGMYIEPEEYTDNAVNEKSAVFELYGVPTNMTYRSTADLPYRDFVFDIYESDNPDKDTDSFVCVRRDTGKVFRTVGYPTSAIDISCTSESELRAKAIEYISGISDIDLSGAECTVYTAGWSYSENGMSGWTREGFAVAENENEVIRRYRIVYGFSVERLKISAGAEVVFSSRGSVIVQVIDPPELTAEQKELLSGITEDALIATAFEFWEPGLDENEIITGIELKSAVCFVKNGKVGISAFYEVNFDTPGGNYVDILGIYIYPD